MRRLDRLLRRTPPATLAWTCPWFIVITIASAWTIITGVIDGSVVALIAVGVAVVTSGLCVGVRIRHRAPFRGGSCQR